MTPKTARKAAAYVRKYGKDWTGEQVAEFFVAVADLASPTDRSSAGEDA